MARNVVLALEGRREPDAARAQRTCCEPTRACLAARLAAAEGEAQAVISTPEQAREWLEGRAIAPLAPEIRFLDALERLAEVTDSRGRARRWAHLYGCWIAVESLESR